MISTTYVDADLYHNLSTGRSVTEILHLLDQAPIDWYSKKIATVETATYGTVFVSTHMRGTGDCLEEYIEVFGCPGPREKLHVW